MAELEKAANITSTPIPRIIINRSDTIGSQAFRMVLKNKRAVELRGGDEAGIMYELLDLADQIRYSDLETGVGESQGNPFIERRGLKFNIPLDATLELVINDIELVKTIQP